MGLKTGGGNALRPNKRKIEKIFLEKRQRRMRLARLPIEEKIKILVKLQQIALPILAARGLERAVWKL